MSRPLLPLLAVFVGVGCSPPTGPTNAPGIASATPPASSSAPEPVVMAQPPQTFDELGMQVVQWLHAGKNGEVFALFDDKMKSALPNADAVGQLWGTLESQLGKFDKILGTMDKARGDYLVVQVACVFSSLPMVMDVRIVFDQSRHIAGVTVAPSENPDVYGARPQTPKPPFPYDVREVAFDDDTSKTHYAGTLTVPQGAGPFPAVLLITGSGLQDRDESLFGHKSFLVIANQLTLHGIAVLRVDDPGAGASTRAATGETMQTHADDVATSLAFLAKQTGIDPKHLGLVGHSEGGILAAMVAARSKDVSFLVSLAGTGLSGADIIPLQVEAMLRAQGTVDAAGRKALVAAQRNVTKLAAADADDKTLDKAVKQAFELARKYAASDADKEATTKELSSALGPLKSPWMKSFLKLDPKTYWQKVTVPVLALNGEKDTQVAADLNLAAIKSALAKAKNKDVTIEKRQGLNHLFQPAKTGLVEEYGTIETTFDQPTLDAMTTWIVQRATGVIPGAK